MQLFPDQEKFLDDIRLSIRSGKRAILCVAPTGFGKSVVAANMIAGAAKRGHNTIFTVHRRILLPQMAGTIGRFGVPYSYIAAGMPHNRFAKCHIASIDTLKNRKEKFAPKILFCDEAHFSLSGGWLDVLEYYKDAGTIIISLTATPWRADGLGFIVFYDDMVEAPQLSWLIENKRLSTYKMYAPSTIDVSGLSVRGGEFARDELEDRARKATITGNLIEHYRKYCPGARAIGFGASVKHSKELAQQFCAAGIRAAHIDAETPDDERSRIIADFADGIILILFNCFIFAEGFDLAAQAGRDVTIEALLDASPTLSLSRQLQKWGRVLRYKDYPAVIIDAAGNYGRHGFPDDHREWTLEAREKKTRGDAKESMDVKQCPTCYHVHKPSPSCPDCGYVYPSKEREIEHVSGNLIEVKRSAKDELIERKKLARSLDDMINLFIERGHKDPYKAAAKAYTEKLVGKY